MRSTLTLAMVLLAATPVVAEEWKSGPQVGDGVPGGFSTLFVNGDQGGNRRCPVWVRGYDVVALIFVREINDPLTSLVKRIDKELVDVSIGRSGPRRGVFVIYCNSAAGINDQLKDLVAREGLKQIVLCSTTAEGPRRYNLARDADMTVVIYNRERTVTTNWALKAGELNEAKADEIVKGIAEMLRK